MQSSVDTRVSEFRSQMTKVLISKYGEREAQAIVRILVEDLLIPLYIAENENIGLGLPLQDLILSIHKQLEQDVPVQYIVEKAWFFGYPFKVSPACLIPRPETEELVEWCLSEMPNSPNIRVLDIGTGSGCIPITIKKKRPFVQVTAFDISPDALQIAKYNAQILEVDIDFQEVDFLNLKSYPTIFDYIISNPPYIPYHEKDKMDDSVVKHEPSIALFVENEDPLIFYRKIMEFAKTNLSPSGKVFLECNEFNANEVQNLFSSNGFNTTLKKDIFGKERMVMVS